MNNRFVLDVTTVLTLCSDISRNPNIFKYYKEKERWTKFNNNIYNQIEDEEKDPVYPKLWSLIKEGDLIITQSCYQRTSDMIKNMASDTEKKAFEELKTRLTIVNDDPSERFLELKNKMWSDDNINTFGTADKYGWTIVSGNIRAVTFVIKTKNFDLKYLAHRSRRIIGEKYFIDDSELTVQ